jgi:hypothetical protein
LAARFGPLFKKPPKPEVHRAGASCTAILRLDVAGWKQSFLEESGGDFAFATDYPLNARHLIRAQKGEGVLLPLGRGLEADPAPILRELAPPMAMIWSRGDALFLQNDGLGQGQWLEYEDDCLWAATNRIGALSALGIPLEPVPLDWAVRFTLGWFTGESTGYRGVRLLRPGTQIRLDAEGIHRRRTEVLGEWIRPQPMTPEQCLELARTSFESVLREAADQWDNASVGLSGGWDSRAVVAVLRTLDTKFELRVRGHPRRLDVMIANELARIAKLPIRIKTKGGVPPSTAEDCRSCIERALLWQGGHMTLLKHKTFLAKRGVMDGGVVNVMGQHSGIGKGDFASRIHAEDLSPEQYEDALLDSLMEEAPPILREEVRGPVRERIREAYREADAYDLKGLHRLHFFFLFEYTRRWGAATINAQNGMVVAPFLNPGLIQAAYAFPGECLPERPFHSYITEHYAPDWSTYPYESQFTYQQVLDGTGIPPADVQIDEEKDLPLWRRGKRWNKYHQALYWDLVSAPLVKEALASEGWWREIFDRASAAEEWNRTKGVADALVVAHLLPDK